MNRVGFLYVNKGFRVFAFGFVSILVPIYLATVGYAPIYIGIAIASIVGGNVFSNLLLTFYGDRLGRKNLLLGFSLLMVVSGLLLFITSSLPFILIAGFIGNISTTGTEAGPFQSVEAGILPSLVQEMKINRSFGVYNLIGYAASSVGALASSIPTYFKDDLGVFHIMFLVYGFVGLLLFAMYLGLGDIESSRHGIRKPRLLGISERSKSDVGTLSVLSFMDAFGGGFVSQSILVYWFFIVYRVSLGDLGLIFAIVNVITAASIFGASLIADKIGNLRTMVYTHLVSNAFLISIPLVGSLPAALLLLFLRQSMSQMDVPTRQAFMAQIFQKDDRVSSYAITNTFRSIGSLFGGPLSGVMISAALYGLPILAGGVSKIVYDLSIFGAYRRRVK